MTTARLSVWPPLPPDVHLRSPRHQLPFPLGDENCRYFSRARHGLWHGLLALGLEPGDSVLVPAYHHGSEIEALVRAGINCLFYDCDERLEPLEEGLEQLLDRGPRALYLTHYLGFPQDAPRWSSWCRRHGLLLIEDAAQAFLSSWSDRPVGSFGDLAVYCLYKTFGVPDGAALVSRTPPDPPPPRGRFDVAPTIGRHAAWVRLRWPARAPHPSPPGSQSEYSPESDFALGDANRPPSRMTVRLVKRLADVSAAERRRANYRFLLDELGHQVAPPFAKLPAGASPFVFPIGTDDKARLLQRLQRGGVDALNFWSVPHPRLAAAEFPRAASLRATILGLPVHQELRPSHLRMIVDAVR